MILVYEMETVKVHIRCTMCRKFDKFIDVDVNEHGFFEIPEAHCPECLCILEQDIDGRRKTTS